MYTTNDTCTTIAQTLRYLQLVSRIRKLIIEDETIGYKRLQNNPQYVVLDTAMLCTDPLMRRHCNVSHNKKCLERYVLFYTVVDLVTLFYDDGDNLRRNLPIVSIPRSIRNNVTCAIIYFHRSNRLPPIAEMAERHT